MTLDANLPVDSAIASELAAYIRETRAAVNSQGGSGEIGVSNVTVSAGATSLSIGTELSIDSVEVVFIDAAAAVTLTHIYGGTEGQIKILVFQDNNISITDGNAKTGGVPYLNHLPAASDFAAQQDDVLVLVNKDGDGGASHGYWKELYRTLSVK